MVSHKQSKGYKFEVVSKTTLKNNKTTLELFKHHPVQLTPFGKFHLLSGLQQTHMSSTTFPLRRFYRSVLKWVSDRGSVSIRIPQFGTNFKYD